MKLPLSRINCSRWWRTTDANFNAGEINTFAAYFQQFGGWWANGNALGGSVPKRIEQCHGCACS